MPKCIVVHMYFRICRIRRLQSGHSRRRLQQYGHRLLLVCPRHGDYCSYDGIVYQTSSSHCPTKDVSDAVKAVVGGVLVVMIVGPICCCICVIALIVYFMRQRRPSVVMQPGMMQPATMQPGMMQQGYVAQQPGYAAQPGAYPQQQPGAYPQQQPGAYPQQQPGAYPQQQPGAYPQQPYSQAVPVEAQPQQAKTDVAEQPYNPNL